VRLRGSDDEVRKNVEKLLGAGSDVHVCDVERDDQIARLHDELAERGEKFHGLVHSLAFADYSDGPRPFHETSKRAFLQAVEVSCFSLTAVSNAMKDLLDSDASVVDDLDFDPPQMASESYGYMAPIKAALDSSLAFLAKSFSRFSRIRFNAVAPGLLKTSASAGIPRYVDALPVCRAGDSAEAGGADGGGCQRGGVSIEPAFRAASTPGGSWSMRACRSTTSTAS